MHCSNCGQLVNSDAKFCQHCGAEVQKPLSVSETPPAAPPMKASPFQCPMCLQSDQIAKLSAILTRDVRQVEGTTRQWVGQEHTGHWENVTINSTEASALAQRLTPPEKPGAMPSIAWFGLPFSGFIMWFAQWRAPIPRTFKLVLTGMIIFILFGLCLGVLLASTNDNQFLEVVAQGICGISIFLIPVYWVIYWIGLVSQMGVTKTQAQAEMPRWEKAIDKWNELYYCFRNDCVFDPSSGKAVPADRMTELLYE